VKAQKGIIGALSLALTARSPRTRIRRSARSRHRRRLVGAVALRDGPSALRGRDIQPGDQAPEGEPLNVTAAARQLGIAPSTLLRWLDDGFVAGEQVTPGAPWQIRVTDELRGMLTSDAPDGWLALHHASRALGVSRQTVLQKVKRGELRAVLTRTGRRKGLRIEVPAPQDSLF